MKNREIDVDLSTLARPDTKMESALKIYQKHLGDPNHRQLCLAEFQDKLGFVDTAAATYYKLCDDKVEGYFSEMTNEVLSSNAVRKYSAVRTKRGSNVIARVHVFTKKKEATKFNELYGYTEVVPGVAEVGDEVAA